MPRLKFALLAFVLMGLSIVASCHDKDEQQAGASKTTGSTQAAAQEPSQKTDEEEEGEEGPSTSAASRPGKPAPQQSAGKQFVYDFESDIPGRSPAKFHTAKTGRGASEKWAVTAAPTAPSKPNVVAQTSTDRTDYRFPLLIADEGSFQDLEVSVKFKAVSGSVDRAAGLVFRLKDPNNYYIVRINALETITGSITWSMAAVCSSPEPISRSAQEIGTSCGWRWWGTRSPAITMATRRSRRRTTHSRMPAKLACGQKPILSLISTT